MRGAESMSVAYSDWLSDLLCCEEDSGIMSDTFSLDIDSSVNTDESQTDESIVKFISGERNYVPGIDYVEGLQSGSLDSLSRKESVSWIFKVQAYYGFQPLTAYLSVNYLDRFLYSRRLPKTDGWPMQLLSVTCLSLAAKMEEQLVPSLLDLQIEGAKYIFEPRTIRRMELLVLSVLDWRLRSITPFSYISYFASKLDPTRAYTDILISRATRIILSSIQEASFLKYWPSCIAMSAIICASRDVSIFFPFKPSNAESWCEGLSKEKIIGCYELMQEVNHTDGTYKHHQKVRPQMEVMSRVISGSGDSSSSSSTSSPCKRRKLNNTLWVYDDKEYSD